jgi:hypothetical protein
MEQIESLYKKPASILVVGLQEWRDVFAPPPPFLIVYLSLAFRLYLSTLLVSDLLLMCLSETVLLLCNRSPFCYSFPFIDESVFPHLLISSSILFQ